MDVISHALIGKIFCYFDKKARGLSQQFWVIFFSTMPDLVLIPFYIVLGKNNQRFLWIAQNQDWNGASTAYPFLTSLYNSTHSIFFAFLIILPIVFLLKLPKSAFFVYLFHIIIDIFTHTGEWAIKPFFPLNNFEINGFSDVWAWPIWVMALSWIVLILIIFSLNIFKKRNDKSLNKS